MSATEVCNMSLARIGATRISDYTTDASLQGIYCRLFYEQNAKALMRSHWWWFAKHRIQLSQDGDYTVPFQWDYAFSLPNDFLRLVRVYDGSTLPDERTCYSYELEGTHLLIDDSTTYIQYIRWIEDTAKWDPLFTEVHILTMARKLVVPLSQDIDLKKDIDAELKPLMSKVRALDRQEGESIGRYAQLTHLDGRRDPIA